MTHSILLYDNGDYNCPLSFRTVINNFVNGNFNVLFRYQNYWKFQVI